MSQLGDDLRDDGVPRPAVKHTTGHALPTCNVSEFLAGRISEPIFLLRREGSAEPARLMLRVHLDPEACDHGPFLYMSDEEVERLPAPLASRGLTDEEYFPWLLDLQDLRRKLPIGCHPLHVAFAVLSFAGGDMCLPAPGKRAFLSSLSDWQRRYNAVLSKHGLAVRTQSYGWRTSVGGRGFTYVRSWLTFALGAEEAVRLGQEPHLLGHVRDSFLDCGAMSESGQPIHLGGADGFWMGRTHE